MIKAGMHQMNLIIIFVGFLSAFFLFASSIKFFGWQKFIFEIQLAMFVKYGLNRQFIFIVGFAELFGAVTIWFQGSWLGTIGALTLLVTSVGAIGCHLIWYSWKEGIAAMVTGVLSASVVWSGKASLFILFGLS